MTPLLIARSNDSRFLAPTEHPEVAGSLLRKHRGNLRATLVVTSLTALSMLVPLVLTGAAIFLLGFLAFASVIVVMMIEYSLSRTGASALSERSRFIYWSFNQKTTIRAFCVWLVVMLLAGSMQLWFRVIDGDIEGLFLAAGVVHEHVLAGEVWRLLVGPFFHSSPSHFLVNLVYVLLVGPLSWGVYRTLSILVFLSGNAIGALASAMRYAYIDNYPFDAYAGISSGIFALTGCLFAGSLLHRKLLPQGFGVLLFLIATSSILLSEALSATAATVSHVAGLALGVVLGVLFVGWCPVKPSAEAGRRG